jgi:hypothetical protein
MKLVHNSLLSNARPYSRRQKCEFTSRDVEDGFSDGF